MVGHNRSEGESVGMDADFLLPVDQCSESTPVETVGALFRGYRHDSLQMREF